MATNVIKIDRTRYSPKKIKSVDIEEENILKSALEKVLDNPTSTYSLNDKKLNNKIDVLSKTVKLIKTDTTEIRKAIKLLNDKIGDSSGGSLGLGDFATSAAVGIGAGSLMKNMVKSLKSGATQAIKRFAGPVAMAAIMDEIGNATGINKSVDDFLDNNVFDLSGFMFEHFGVGMDRSQPGQQLQKPEDRFINKLLKKGPGMNSGNTKNRFKGFTDPKIADDRKIKADQIKKVLQKRYSSFTSGVEKSKNNIAPQKQINSKIPNTVNMEMTPTELAMSMFPDRLSGKNVSYGSYGTQFNKTGISMGGDGGYNYYSGTQDTTSNGQQNVPDNRGSKPPRKITNHGPIDTTGMSQEQISKYKELGIISVGPIGGHFGPKSEFSGQIPEIISPPQKIDASGFMDPKTNTNVNEDVLKKYKGKRLPVSIRNNNPGAISINGDTDKSWAAQQPGFVGTSLRPANEGGSYAKYATPEHGVAASSKLLEKYGENGINTTDSIVRKWSTDSSAWANYSKTLQNELGITDGNQQLDLNDPKIRAKILRAQSAHESGTGKPIYSSGVYDRGVAGIFPESKGNKKMTTYYPSPDVSWNKSTKDTDLSVASSGSSKDSNYEDILKKYDSHPERKNSISGIKKETQARVGAMFRDAPDSVKKELRIVSGFRDQTTQNALYNKSGGSGMVAKHSKHTEGYAVDLGAAGKGSAGSGWKSLSPETKKWVVDNAEKYGLYRPLQPGKTSITEDWHFEPIGSRSGSKNQPVANMADWKDPGLKTNTDTQIVKKDQSGDVMKGTSDRFDKVDSILGPIKKSTVPLGDIFADNPTDIKKYDDLFEKAKKGDYSGLENTGNRFDEIYKNSQELNKLKSELENIKKSNSAVVSTPNQTSLPSKEKKSQEEIKPPRTYVTPSVAKHEKRMGLRVPDESYGDDNARYGGPR